MLNLLIKKAFFVALLALPAVAPAMVQLEEGEMASVTGTGIAVALDNIIASMAPTSYIELTGTATALPWKRGDVRYYGLTFSGGQTGAGTGTSFGRGNPAGEVTTVCDTSTTVGCPIGTLPVKDFASVYDPYVLRAFQYVGYDYQGTLRNTTTGAAAMPTVLELVGPSNSDRWRWAFWGELESDRGGASPGYLQSQTIINGKPVTVDGKPSILRMFRTANTADSTFGLTYQSALSGDFRFSVGQKATSPNLLRQVPFFNNSEGLYFYNVDAFLPMGRLHSQALTADTVGTSGNFRLTLTPIANIANVYNDFYCGNAAVCTTVVESVDFFGRSVTAIASPNPDTHGYVRWGDFSNPANYTAANNGVQFYNNAGAQVAHLGVSRMDGMLIQRLEVTTLSAGP